MHQDRRIILYEFKKPPKGGFLFAEFLEGTLFSLILLAPYLVIIAVFVIVIVIVVKHRKKKAAAKKEIKDEK